MEIHHAATETDTRALGATLAGRLRVGDTVLLEGPLGSGKTTLVRGLVEALGHHGPVRSPTFNLIQIFPTEPPIAHADLYRVGTSEGVGLEDYLDTHLCLIEWPDRAKGLVDAHFAWQVTIEFDGPGRKITVVPPQA